jgi:hypothetical protein
MEFAGKNVKNITFADTTAVKCADIPPNSVIHSIECLVATAFNATGTDIIQIGTAANPTAYVTSIDVSSAGKATVTLTAAACAILSTTANTEIYARYVPSTSVRGAGSAYIVISSVQL